MKTNFPLGIKMSYVLFLKKKKNQSFLHPPRKLVIFQFLFFIFFKLWVLFFVFFIRQKFAGYNLQKFTSVKTVNGLVFVPCTQKADF